MVRQIKQDGQQLGHHTAVIVGDKLFDEAQEILRFDLVLEEVFRKKAEVLDENLNAQ